MRRPVGGKEAMPKRSEHVWREDMREITWELSERGGARRNAEREKRLEIRWKASSVRSQNNVKYNHKHAISITLYSTTIIMYP